MSETTNTPHLINFELGDWSQDGHNESECFNVWSNKPVEHLRELHFAATTALGIDIGEICSDYEDATISTHQIGQMLIAGVFKYGTPIWQKLLNYLCIDEEDISLQHIELLKLMAAENRGANSDEEVDIIDMIVAIEDDEDFEPSDLAADLDFVFDIWVRCLEVQDPDLVLKTDNTFDTIEASAEVIAIIRHLADHSVGADPVILEKVSRMLTLSDAPARDMHFYGFDKQGRHLHVPGYGCFSF